MGATGSVVFAGKSEEICRNGGWKPNSSSEGVTGDHPSKLTAGLMSAFRAHFRGGERAERVHGGGRNNKGWKVFYKACERRIEGTGEVIQPEQNPCLSLWD